MCRWWEVLKAEPSFLTAPLLLLHTFRCEIDGSSKNCILHYLVLLTDISETSKQAIFFLKRIKNFHSITLITAESYDNDNSCACWIDKRSLHMPIQTCLRFICIGIRLSDLLAWNSRSTLQLCEKFSGCCTYVNVAKLYK